MVKTKLSLMEKFLKMATSESELARFFSNSGENVTQTLYKNGRTVYESIENGVRKFFSINPLTNTVKEGTVVSNISKLGKKASNTKVVFHEGALQKVDATRVFNNDFGAGSVILNAGGKSSAVYNPVSNAVRI